MLIIDEKNGDVVKDIDVTDTFKAQDARTDDFYLIAADDAYMYLAGSDGRAVYALNTSTYVIDWKYKFEIPSMSWLSDIRIQDNRLFVLDDLGNLYVFKRD